LPVCRILNEIWTQLARKYVNVKFIKATATKCVENFHDSHCPGFFIYKNGELISSDVPAGSLFGGERMNMDSVEYVLGQKGIIEVDFEEDPRDKLKLLNMITKRGKDVMRRHE
jgi:hypothetical protein